MDFQAIRKEYESRGLNEAEMLEDPIKEFRIWFELATEQSPGRWFETNAMTLATTDLDGNVTARAVLLKDIRDDGFVFFTNYGSTKGKQLELNPKMALMFHWPYLGRQVRIEGSVTKTTREVSEEYFHSRPRGSQIGAAVSAQSNVIASRDELQNAANELEKSLDGAIVPCPSNWGGYFVSPSRIEFWQGRLDRLHERIVYEGCKDKGWSRSRLSP